MSAPAAAGPRALRLPALRLPVLRLPSLRDGDGALLALRRAWPADLREPGPDLVLELLRPAGPGAAPEVVGAVVEDGVLRLRREDPALPALAALRRAPGAGVVGHRAGRRAVVRSDDGAFAKVARRSATRRALERLAAVDALLADVPAAPGRPRVREADAGAGLVLLEPAAGQPLEGLLAAASTGACHRAGRALGAALCALARADPSGPASAGDRPRGWPTHTAEDEATTTRRWTTAARAAGALDAAAGHALDRRQDRALAALAALPPAPPVAAHRDLHEGQVLLGPSSSGASSSGASSRGGGSSGAAVVLLDWDTAALADPAADVANLLAHLDLLARRRPDRAQAAGAAGEGLLAALVEGGHPLVDLPAARRRVAVLREVAAVRLVAVHAFRPA